MVGRVKTLLVYRGPSSCLTSRSPKTMTIFLSGSIMITQHVFHSGCPTYPCCGELDRGNDFSLPRPGTLGQRSESGTGIHGVVSVCGAGISSRRLDGYSSIAYYRPDVVGTSRYQCGESWLVVGDRDREVDAGRPIVVSDPPPRSCLRPSGESGQCDSGIPANAQ